MPSAGWERSVDRAVPNAHHTRLWKGGVGKEAQQEELAAVELLKQVLFTRIYVIILTGPWGAEGVVLPLLTAFGGTCRNPAWHMAVWGLTAAEMTREFRCGERTVSYTISHRDALK